MNASFCDSTGTADDEDLRIRSMSREDIKDVLEIERRSFPTPWKRTVFLTEIEQNVSADYIVAEAENEVLGYAGMWIFLHESHITNIAVHPDEREKGIGGFLLLSLMNRSMRFKVYRMTLEVRESNDIAKIFYRNYGFKVRGIRRNYYTDTDEDAIVMICEDIRDVFHYRDISDSEEIK